MEIKSYADILSLHTKFAEEVEKQTANIREKLPKSPEALLKAKQAKLTEARKAVTKCKRNKSKVVKRFDTDIGNLRNEVDRLAGEVRGIEKKLVGSKPKRRKPKK